LSSASGTQVLSFENFGTLESYLRALKNAYNDRIKEYEETLGYLLRDASQTNSKNQKIQTRWALEIQRSISTRANASGKSPAAVTIAKKIPKDNHISSSPLPSKLFRKGRSKDNTEKQESSDGWIHLEPISIFIGAKNRGLAELYFDTINTLKENVIKINSSLAICSTLKVKAASAGSASLMVSFVNDIPTRVMFNSFKDGESKKYTMAFSFAVPSVSAM